MWRIALFLMLPGLVGVPFCSAVVYTIHSDGSGDFPTIDAAMQAVSPGDVIELTDGTFIGEGNRGVHFDKELTVRSQTGNPEACVIDLDGANMPAFRFYTTVGPAAVLEGIKIANGATWSGGMALHATGATASPLIQSCIFAGHEAQDDASAVYWNGGEPCFVGCDFTDNTNQSDQLGGAVFFENGTLHLVDCSFAGNSAGGGGAVCVWSWYAQPEAALIADACEFTENTAQDGGKYGGAVYLLGSSGELTACHFEQNIAQNGATGADVGVWKYWTGSPISVTIDSCTFLDNTGGGVYAEAEPEDQIDVEDCHLEGSVGCALFFDGCTGSINRCVFVGNQQWAPVTCIGSSHMISACTFYDNPGENASALFYQNAQVTLENSILSFSPNPFSPPVDGSGPVPTLTCCDIYGNAVGDWMGPIADQYGVAGNIQEDPLFCDRVNDDLTIADVSPCAPDMSGGCGLIGALPVGCEYTSVQEPISPPDRNNLFPNRPNPFNPVTEIRYTISERGDVRLTIHDLRGRLVATISNRFHEAGEFVVTWDGRGDDKRLLPSGAYFVRMVSPDFTTTRKITLLR